MKSTIDAPLYVCKFIGRKSCLWVHTKIVLLKTHIELQIFIKKLFLAGS